MLNSATLLLSATTVCLSPPPLNWPPLPHNSALPHCLRNTVTLPDKQEKLQESNSFSFLSFFYLVSLAL